MIIQIIFGKIPFATYRVKVNVFFVLQNPGYLFLYSWNPFAKFHVFYLLHLPHKVLMCRFALMFSKIGMQYILGSFPGVFPFRFSEVVAK